MTASSSGAAAPERRINAWVSGSMIGSSQLPCTKNGSSNVGGAALSFSRLAVPLRSSSRAGMEARPLRARRTLAPIKRPSSRFAVPSEIRNAIASCSKAVRPLRKSALPASGRRSSRRRSCSTSKPVSAPWFAARVTVPFIVRASANTLRPSASSSSDRSPLPSRRWKPNNSVRLVSRSTLVSRTCERSCAPVFVLAIATEPLIKPLKPCDSPTVTVNWSLRRVAATAVRPSRLWPATTRAAETRRSRSTASNQSSVICLRSHTRAPEASRCTADV